MSSVSPLGLQDFAVIGALVTADALEVDRVVKVIAVPPSGPGMSLSDDAVRCILARLAARGLAENTCQGWKLTRRGRALWGSKGSRFTL
ncbi:hypothetical protein NS506_06707 [Nocardia seriolae]|uniref:Uncharacterized protein n=1 Tax=Nocardia seriolae TaxID=37332 RepID=A0ABC8B423_9NOCA|nr:hypothetical protein [Nocardia seriolae]APB00738.1 hypothetical protein NS506_06707 [Nocardia seriolae]